ncbi:MAG: DUF2807 domain-containing protein [Spirochaetaceae bacterium]|jgi:hypothetical protein|nr:DUF2807 domain-containing protein [Spirochaetaceae bacterium]
MINWKLLTVAVAMIGIGVGFAFATGRNDEDESGVVSREHRLQGFEELYLKANADLRLHQAAETRVVITADAALHDRIELKMKKNQLEISVKGREDRFPRFSVDVYCPVLSGIGAAYAGTIEFSDGIAAPVFMIGLAGAATINGTLECDTVQVNMAGAGTVRLIGSAENAEVHLVGEGTIDAEDFRAANFSANIVGDGTITTWTTGALTTTIVGNGTINYRGDPVMEFTGMGNGRFIRLP